MCLYAYNDELFYAYGHSKEYAEYQIVNMKV